MNGNGFVKLRLIGENLNIDEISTMLSHKPSFTYRKGDRYTPKYGNKNPIIYEEDCWLLEKEKGTEESFDDAVNKFLYEFKDSADYLKKLSSEFDVTLWVSVYPDENQGSIHLSSNTLQLIADMGISVDLSILFLKEFYDGTSNE